MTDLEELFKKANELDIKIILDFVPNHSSHKCEWFQKSIKREDPYTDFYIWRDGKKNNDGTISKDPPNNWVNFVLKKRFRNSFFHCSLIKLFSKLAIDFLWISMDLE